MVTKEQLELLKAHPEAMQRFCDALERQATVVGIEIEIQKISDSLRANLWALRECNLPVASVLATVRDRKRDLLEICAVAVGTERGKRLGKQAGERTISEAQSFGALQAEKYALRKLGEVKGESDD